MTNKGFDFKQFVLHFDSVFSNQEIGKEFHSFLKTEFNEEPWLFLCEVKKLQEGKQLVTKTLEIIENHLLESSKYEINVSGKVKFPVLKDFESQKNNLEEWMFDATPDKLFDEICKIIKDELYHDPWKRFLRTKVCEKIIFKYQNDSMICSPQITEKFNYTDEYFQHRFIFKQDFDFGEELMKDNFQWELMGSHVEGKMNTYYSNLNYLPGLKFSSNLHVMKHEIILEMDFQQVLLSLGTRRSVNKNDPNITKIDSIDYYHEKELKKLYFDKGWDEEAHGVNYDLTTNTFDLIFPFPLNGRKIYQSNAKTYDPKTRTILSVSKPFVPDGLQFLKSSMIDVCPKLGMPPKKMKVYPMFGFVFMKYQKLDEKKTLFSQVHILDVGGWSRNQKLFKLVAKSRGSKFRENMSNLETGFPDGSTIEENKEELVKEENGIPVDGFGKLLYYLKIEEKEQIFEKTRSKRVQSIIQ
eukprot:gene10992-3698_t